MTVRLNKEGENSRTSDFFGHFGPGVQPVVVANSKTCLLWLLHTLPFFMFNSMYS